MEFSRQEYWSGLPFPNPGIFPTQGWSLGLPGCRQILYHLSPRRSPREDSVVASLLAREQISGLCESVPSACAMPPRTQRTLKPQLWKGPELEAAEVEQLPATVSFAVSRNGILKVGQPWLV